MQAYGGGRGTDDGGRDRGDKGGIERGCGHCCEGHSRWEREERVKPKPEPKRGGGAALEVRVGAVWVVEPESIQDV